MGKLTNAAQMGDIIKIPGKEGCYVVERAEDQGGGIGHHPGDQYPNGHHITARLLNDGMYYAPDNAVLTFYQSGKFDLAQTVLIEQVEVVGTMQRTFVEPAGEAVAPAPVAEPEAVAEPEPAPVAEPEAVAEPAGEAVEPAPEPEPVKKKTAKKKTAKKKTAKKKTAVE